jgi:hypothetical protein
MLSISVNSSEFQSIQGDADADADNAVLADAMSFYMIGFEEAISPSARHGPSH